MPLVSVACLLSIAGATAAPMNSSLSAKSEVSTIAQQQATVSGRVVDEKGEPLIGVSIMEAGTGNGTVTDIDGAFRLTLKNPKAKLTISYVGYATQTVQASDKMQITLRSDNTELQEVVVVGYGTQKKANLTGAVDQVTSKALENRPVSNLTQGLQGEIPNLQISFADGKPTRSSSYQVRGTGSIGQGGNALVLIDGVEGDPAMLNPSDVASVTVLKDASAAAIYGARGTYGVVLITTKDPDKEKVTVNYSGNFFIKSPTVVPDVVTDGYDYTTYFLQAYTGWTGGSKPSNFHHSLKYSDQWYEELAKHRTGSGLSDVEVDPKTGKYVYYGNTDWWDMLYKDSFTGQEQNLSIQGGGKKADFLLSGRFYSQNGVFNFDPDKYKMFNIRAKGGLQVTDWLKVTNNFEFSQMEYHNPMSVGEGNVWYAIESEGQAPNVMFNPDGTLTQAGATILGSFYYGNNYEDFTTRVLRNTSSFTTSFFKNRLHINGDITFRYTDENIDGKQTPVPYSTAPGTTKYMGSSFNSIMKSTSSTKYLATNIYAQYEQTFAKVHDVKAMLGWNYEQSIYNYDFEKRNQLIYSGAKNINLTTGSININSNYNKWRIAGGFYRVNYSFAERYLLELSGRYDGSSKFPNNQQWKFFPSGSAGWRVSQEPFWHISPKAISNLKLRASYGSLGNGNISPYQFQELFSIYQQNRLLRGQKNITTSSPNPIPDGLTWETATTTNFGVDAGFLNDRLTLVADYYIRKNKDMYVPGTELPAVYGATPPKGNYADMTTHGWEITLTWHDQFNLAEKPFHYQVRATLADAKTKIDKYPNKDKFIGASSYTPDVHNYYEGMTLGEIWGLVTDGYLTDKDVDGKGHIINGPDQSEIMPNNANKWEAGDLKFKDLDGNNKISWGNSKVGDSGDRKVIGNKLPRYTFSLGLNADWNGIFFSAFFQGVGKQDWWPGSDNGMFWGPYSRPYSNFPKEMIGNWWTEDNPNAYFPRLRGYTAHQWNRQLHLTQTKYLQNVAYIRLKNIQLGYSLPKAWISKIGLQACRLYVSGENLLTITPFYKHIKQFDVESINGDDLETLNLVNSGLYTTPMLTDGGRSYNYPILKTVTFGISLTL